MYLQLYERFRPGQKPPTKLGSSRDYNVDMVPKFIMAGGELVRVLVHTGVSESVSRTMSVSRAINFYEHTHLPLSLCRGSQHNLCTASSASTVLACLTTNRNFLLQPPMASALRKPAFSCCQHTGHGYVCIMQSSQARCLQM